MYIFTGRRRPQRSTKKKSARYRAAAKAKERRRQNRMHGRPLGRRATKRK